MNDVSTPLGAFSRRRALALFGGTGLAATLSACSVSTSDSNKGDSGAPPAPKNGIKIPNSGAKLPSGDVTVNWMDSGDLKALFEEPLFKAYNAAHKNIKISYDGTSWERINEAIPLGVRNGSAPDVFAVPNNVPTQVAINEGWVAPIDDLVPDFAKWKAGFPANSFIPGVHIFDGKTYTWPASSTKRYGQMLMYDPDYLNKAGVDMTQRMTWDEFRAACKKVTKDGSGKYYGLLTSGVQLGPLAMSFAQLAGLTTTGDGMNWKTGEYAFTAPELEAAIELLLAIKSDGSFFPDYQSLADADSRARMPTRVAGMIFDGPWDIPKWPQTNPGYKFEIAYPPQPNDKKQNYSPYQELGANQVFIFAKSKYKEVAGDLFSYMGSHAGQVNMMIYSGGNLTSEQPAALAEAQKSTKVTPHAQQAIKIADDLMRVAPMVQVRNADSADVILALKPPKVGFPEVVQGIFTGQVKDVKKALKSLQDQSDSALDAAISTATKRGAKISRDDWKFPNWDPAKDYTEADYKALGN
ncbi:MAG TPA: extracellular solute-binding protein [Mycobacteriales bacterium]|nr:extracellular solute-binding protein [Mycobacteriales bacterium]